MLLCSEFVLPISSPPFRDGAILVRDGIIRDIGHAPNMQRRYPDEEVKDFGRAALMPGFVDLYTRLEDSIFRGLVEDVPFATWVAKVLEKSQDMDVNDWYDSAILGALDCLSCGVTTVADITYNGAACNAVQKLGMRAVIYREVRAMDKKRVSYAMKGARSDIDTWRSDVDPSRISIGVAPASVFTSHPEVFREVSKLAIEENLPVALRLAGSKEEYNFVRYGSSPFAVDKFKTQRGYVEIPPWLPMGVSPVRYALNWGAFDAPDTMVIHAIQMDDEDVRKLKESDVSVAMCFRANAQLGNGVAPYYDFERAGLRMGIGTDSPAASNSTDMFTEMRSGCMLLRSQPDGFIDNATILELATLGGARALRMDDRIGSLDTGKCADIIAVDLSRSHQAPDGNPVSAVVNTCTSADILLTMVDGNILYEKNHWDVNLDVAKNIARVIEIRGKLKV